MCPECSHFLSRMDIFMQFRQGSYIRHPSSCTLLGSKDVTEIPAQLKWTVEKYLWEKLA